MLCLPPATLICFRYFVASRDLYQVFSFILFFHSVPSWNMLMFLCGHWKLLYSFATCRLLLVAIKCISRSWVFNKIIKNVRNSYLKNFYRNFIIGMKWYWNLKSISQRILTKYAIPLTRKTIFVFNIFNDGTTQDFLLLKLGLEII